VCPEFPCPEYGYKWTYMIKIELIGILGESFIK
jgi:hypothetical protein